MALVVWEGNLRDQSFVGTSSSNPSYVSFSGKLGTVTFSSAAVDLMKIEEGSHIQTLVDKENNEIGFKVVDEDTINIVDVIAQTPPKGDKKVYKIKIRPVLEEFGVDKNQKKIKSSLKKVDDVFVAKLFVSKK